MSLGVWAPEVSGSHIAEPGLFMISLVGPPLQIGSSMSAERIWTFFWCLTLQLHWALQSIFHLGGTAASSLLWLAPSSSSFPASVVSENGPDKAAAAQCGPGSVQGAEVWNWTRFQLLSQPLFPFSVKFCVYNRVREHDSLFKQRLWAIISVWTVHHFKTEKVHKRQWSHGDRSERQPRFSLPHFRVSRQK